MEEKKIRQLRLVDGGLHEGPFGLGMMPRGKVLTHTRGYTKKKKKFTEIKRGPAISWKLVYKGIKNDSCLMNNGLTLKGRFMLVHFVILIYTKILLF